MDVRQEVLKELAEMRRLGQGGMMLKPYVKDGERVATRTIQIEGNNVDNCASLARRELNHPLFTKRAGSRVSQFTASGGEDGLYRLTFETGDIAEVRIVRRARCIVI